MSQAHVCQQALDKIKCKIVKANKLIEFTQNRLDSNGILKELKEDLSTICSLYYLVQKQFDILKWWFIEGLYMILQPYMFIVNIELDKNTLLSYNEVDFDTLIVVIQNMNQYVSQGAEDVKKVIHHVLVNIFGLFV